MQVLNNYYLCVEQLLLITTNMHIIPYIDIMHSFSIYQ